MNAWLHTSSEFIKVFNLTNVDDLRYNSYQFLLGQEQKLYNLVGASNYTEFIAILRKEFGEAEDVKKALNNFKKSNLIINLGLPSQLQLINQQIEFTLTSDVSQDIVGLMKKELGITTDNFVISVEGEPLRLSFDYNESYIKAFLNAYFNGERRFKDNSSTSRSDKTNPLRHANKAFKELAGSGKIGDIVVNQKQVDEHFTVNTNNGGLKSNFQYRKEDINKAIKNNTLEGAHLRQAILKSRIIIYNTLKGFMNGIPDLERAFDRAWTVKLGALNSQNIEKTLEKFSFFSKGDNLSAGVSGAVQELYAVIIAEYINIKLGRGIYGSVAKVLGNIVEGGEQPKTDVQILRSIGIQVKAYSFDRSITQMATNIHPGSLGQALGPYGNENIADTIVQLVFNSTKGDYKDIANDLEPALAQLMSMTTSKEIKDTICFYMVDGQFLVPGSAILNTLRATSFTITIRTNHTPQNDSYFTEEGYERQGDRPDGPNFLEYFNGAKDSWNGPFDTDNVTQENTKLYNALMNHDISIDVKFDYSFMGASSYSIF